MRLREERNAGADARLNAFEHLMVRKYYPRAIEPLPEYNVETSQRYREGLAATLDDVEGEARPVALLALRALRLGRDHEVKAIIEPLLERGPRGDEE